MKKILSLITLLIVVIILLFNFLEITESIKLSFNICINNLFPSIIPFMILSNILINYNFVESISDILGKIMNKLFGVNRACSFSFILSIFTGSPSNSKYLNDLYKNNLIGENDISKCLNFCHFTNPIFVLNTIGYTTLKNKKLGLIVLISTIIGNIIIGILNKKNYIDNNNNIKLNIKNKNFTKILNESIFNTASNLLLILGTITVCLIISTILNSFIKLNNNYRFIYGLIEITQGLNYLSMSNFNIIIKTIIATALISFGGFSIHIQTFSILDNKKILYKPYLISRIVHSILSSIICYLLINIYYI